MNKRKYYLTENRRAFYEKQFEKQSGLCAICGEKTRLVVDHDHLTGIMRALVCYKDNLILGLVKDNPEHLRKAADYLGTFDFQSDILVASKSNYKRDLEELTTALIDDLSYPSDRARARVLVAQMGLNINTALTRIRRQKKKLLTNPS